MSRKVIVTGADGGVGMAVVERLEMEGYEPVCFTFMYKDKEEELVRKGLKVFNCDFRDRSALIAKLKEVSASVGEVLGIVNVAGVYLDLEDFSRDAVANFEETFEVNFWPSLIFAIQFEANITKNGSIVNISSTDAYFGAISGAAYSASKAALNSLTMSLANVFSYKNIRANSVSIGWAGKGMDAPQETLDMASRDNLLGRVAEYDEVADLVEYLLSSRASYINGTVINLDGGDMATNAVLAEENRVLRAQN